MRISIAIALTTALSVATPVSALAADVLNNVYIGISGGASFAEDGDIGVAALSGTAENVIKYDTGWAFSANAGYRFNEFFRTQADFGYLNNDVDKFGNFKANTSLSGVYGLASVYGDYNITERFAAFAGIGAGAFAPRVEDISFPGRTGKADVKVEDNLVALFKVGAGMSYSVNESIDLLVSYDYLRSADFDVKITSGSTPNPGQINLSTHLAQVGLRYNF